MNVTCPKCGQEWFPTEDGLHSRLDCLERRVEMLEAFEEALRMAHQ